MRASLALASFMVCVPVLAGPFVVGDAIHVTSASGYGTNSNRSAVIRISTNPVTISPLAVDGGFTGIGAYDSFRQCVLALRFGTSIASVNSSGVVSSLPLSGNQDATLIAPVIYLLPTTIGGIQPPTTFVPA